MTAAAVAPMLPTAADEPTLDLVLLHGWGFDRQVWAPLLPALSVRFRVHLIDLPGFGDSIDQAFPADMGCLAASLLPRLPQRAAYLGWSLGGSIATWLAAHHPDRVSALVTVATNPCFVQSDGWDSAMPGAEFESFADRVARDGRRGRCYFSALLAQGDRRQTAQLRDFRALANANGVSEPVLQHGLTLLRDLDLRDDIALLQQPLLAVLGQEDRLVPVEIAVELPSLNPHISIWSVAGSAHAPFHSQPQAFVDRIVDFLYQHLGCAPPRRRKCDVARSFSLATDYDEVAGLQREVGEELLAMLPSKSFVSAVDLGCGSGHFIDSLSAAAQRVAGLDIAEGMLLRARKCHSQSTAWICADAEQLPLDEASVDLLFSNLAVQWCEDLEALAAECARVLRPGGNMLLSTLGPSTLWELRAAWREVDAGIHVNRFVPFTDLESAFTGTGLCIVDRRGGVRLRHVHTTIELARELRQLGAHNLDLGRAGGLGGKARWRALDAAYGVHRGADQRLPVSWELRMLRLEKPARSTR